MKKAPTGAFFVISTRARDRQPSKASHHYPLKATAPLRIRRCLLRFLKKSKFFCKNLLTKPILFSIIYESQHGEMAELV